MSLKLARAFLWVLAMYFRSRLMLLVRFADSAKCMAERRLPVI